MAISVMYPAKAGSPKTMLAETITSTSTSMTLVDASVLPPAPNICVIGEDENAEVVLYSGIEGNTVTGLIRALPGSDTYASPWTAGSSVARNFTSYDHNAFKESIEDLDTRKLDEVNWGDIGGTLSTQDDLQSALDSKAPLASPALTGNPTAPTQAISQNSTRLATTAFVHKRGVFYGTGSITAGTTASFSFSQITATMRLIDIYFGTPKNVASDVTWTTAAGKITFTGTFTGTTSVGFYLVETDTLTTS